MIEEALREIGRGTAEIIDNEAIEKLVKNYFEKGEAYSVKAGFDPTAPDLHLGHTVLLQKLATFQKYGARIQFLIGDFTAQIGDPTGKSATRKTLSAIQIEENAKSYKDQVFKILDPEKTDVVFNSEWINPMGASGMLSLTTTFNVARMLERDDFDKRYKSGTSISISEFIYPLLQGYDSVHLQRAYEIGKEQAVLMMPILEGLDGVQKMSKSLNNYIGVADEPNDMFGKVLSISDELMWRYYELLSSKTLAEIEALHVSVQNGSAQTLKEIAAIKTGVAEGSLHPKKVKEDLALEIVERFHSKEAALEAKAEFEKVHSNNDIPTDIEEFELSESPIWIAKALVECKMESSTSQARRDIKQGAVKINQNKIEDEQLQLESGEYILQVGKRKFAKAKVK